MYLEPLRLEERRFLHYSGWSSETIFSLPLHVVIGGHKSLLSAKVIYPHIWILKLYTEETLKVIILRIPVGVASDLCASRYTSQLGVLLLKPI